MLNNITFSLKGNLVKLGDSGRIQTCNLLIRSQMLYSVELRSHISLSECKGSAKNRNCQTIPAFFYEKWQISSACFLLSHISFVFMRKRGAGVVIVPASFPF